MNSIGSEVIGTIIFIVICWFAWTHWLQKPADRYMGFFYFDPSNTSASNSWKQDGFASLDDCRDWLNAQAPRDYDGYYDSECGSNCRMETNVDIYRCEKTF